jgi:hypothetical protein
VSERLARHRRASEAPRHPRRRSVLAVVLALAILVVVNGLVRQTSVEASGARFPVSPPLPVVQMSRPSAWRCPGPLPVGKGRVSSEISIVNDGRTTVGVMVTVSRTGLATDGAVEASSVSRARLEVRAGSQSVLRLSRHGSAGFAAVSVESDGGGVGVAESIVGGQTIGGPVRLSSPCTLGAAARGYVATGSTYLRSEVFFALYDPDATPAVVNVSVSTGSSMISPSAFQGVVVPPTGLVVLNLRRWVPQRSSVAVTATAVSGQIVVGALEATAARVAVASFSGSKRRIRHLRLIGTSLLVGPESGLGRWSFLVEPSSERVSSTFSVFNPGAKSVLVSVAPPGRAGASAALTAEVPAGGVVDFATPIGARGSGPGTVTVSAHDGEPVVVARLSTRIGRGTLEELSATSGTAGPRDEWLLPGAAVTPRVDDVVTLANPGSRPVTVTLVELATEPGAVVRLGVVRVRAGAELALDLGSVLKDAPDFAIRLSATLPVLAEQRFTPTKGLTTAAGGIPVGG